eukprot:2308715-Pyramimonas_sp.AAC.1
MRMVSRASARQLPQTLHVREQSRRLEPPRPGKKQCTSSATKTLGCSISIAISGSSQIIEVLGFSKEKPMPTARHAKH